MPTRSYDGFLQKVNRIGVALSDTLESTLLVDSY